MSKKKKKAVTPLTEEELAEVRALPVSVLAIVRRARPRFAEQGIATVGDVEKVSPSKLMLKCLIGEDDIINIAKQMLKLYRRSLPQRWKMSETRVNVFHRRKAQQLTEPQVEESVLMRLAHSEGQRGHKHKTRKGERGLY